MKEAGHSEETLVSLRDHGTAQEKKEYVCKCSECFRTAYGDTKYAEPLSIPMLDGSILRLALDQRRKQRYTPAQNPRPRKSNWPMQWRKLSSVATRFRTMFTDPRDAPDAPDHPSLVPLAISSDETGRTRPDTLTKDHSLLLRAGFDDQGYPVAASMAPSDQFFDAAFDENAYSAVEPEC